MSDLRLDAAAADALGLEGENRRALVDVGLPRRAAPFFTAAEPERVDLAGRSLVRVGGDGATAVCVDAATGDVVSVSPDGRYPERFVNSDLAAFADFLTRVEDARRRLVAVPDDDAERAVDALASQLRARDPRALADPDAWWSVVVEQIRDGLL